MQQEGTMRLRLERAMRLVGEAGLDGWLIADFRWNNPLFAHLLDLHSGILTRRCFLWLPAPGQGEPAVMASRVDGQAVTDLDCPVVLYAGYGEMAASLRQMLPGGRVAMEYSEDGRLPAISRADAGLVEMVRSLGVEVISSGPLISALEVWDERQQALHERAARGVDEARRLSLRRCEDLLRRGERVTEGTLTEFIRTYFDEQGLAAHDGPDIAGGPNSADPHYNLNGEGAEITRNTVLLIDLWAKVRDVEDAPYADSTWMAWTGESPPADVRVAFDAVRAGRDLAIASIDRAVRSGMPLTGEDVDRVTREFFVAAGFDDRLIHRTGHSLGSEHVHGMGTNLDAIEFPDDRPLLPGSGFTIEPGLYFPGQFGMRLEVSAILQPAGVQVTTEPQMELTLVQP